MEIEGGRLVVQVVCDLQLSAEPVLLFREMEGGRLMVQVVHDLQLSAEPV